MLSVTLALACVAATPSVWQDVPPESDLVVRVEYGKLHQPAEQLWKQLEPLLPLQPLLGARARQTVQRWTTLAEQIEELTGAKLDRPQVTVTASFDLDGSGPVVASAVIRGSFAKASATKRNPKGAVSFEIDGHPALRHERGLQWAFVEGTTLVIGDNRGLPRQLRRLLGKPPAANQDHPLAKVARELRDTAPVLAAFHFDKKMRQRLPQMLGDPGRMLEALEAGTLSASGKRVELGLKGKDTFSKEGTGYGLRALVALVEAGAAKISSEIELGLAMEARDKKSEILPKAFKAGAAQPLLESWLRALAIEVRVRPRPGGRSEATIEASDGRGLAAAALALASYLQRDLQRPLADEAEMLLRQVRTAQLAHRRAKGELLPCGPSPARVPVEAVASSGARCFERLGVRLPKQMRVQLEATVEGGRLQVVARADPDGDGMPVVWVIGEQDERVRHFGSP